MKTDSKSSSVLLGLLVLWTAGEVRGQGVVADAQITGQPGGGGSYNYTIVLNNGNSSSSSIQTFWYAWVPGQDFMPSSPTGIQSPAGWVHSVSGGTAFDPEYGYYYDGYSIMFSTSTSPLAPGGSLSFKFLSDDSPAALAGDSPFYPGYPVGTSYVYSGVGASGNFASFTVQSVPEPSALGLLVVGSVGLFAARRRSGLAEIWWTGVF